MVISDIIKNSMTPSNLGLIKIPFWVIVCFFVIHTDTFIAKFNIDFNISNIKTLVLLFPYFLISLLLFKGVRVVLLVFDNLLDMIRIKYDIRLGNIDCKESKMLTLRELLNYSLKENNSLLYKQYETLKLRRDIKESQLEYGAYFFLALISNVFFKGSVYEYITDFSINEYIVFIPSFILFLIFGIKSLEYNNLIEAHEIDDNLAQEIRESMVKSYVS